MYLAGPGLRSSENIQAVEPLQSLHLPFSLADWEMEPETGRANLWHRGAEMRI